MNAQQALIVQCGPLLLDLRDVMMGWVGSAPHVARAAPKVKRTRFRKPLPPSSHPLHYKFLVSAGMTFWRLTLTGRVVVPAPTDSGTGTSTAS